MSISDENIQALSAFAATAADFCRFAEGLRDGRPADLYEQLEQLLARLHNCILPVQTETPDRDHAEFDDLEMTHEQWSDLAGAIEDAVGDECKELFEWHGGAKPDANAVEKYTAVRAEMLWDDLADIYRDLHPAIVLWQMETPDSQAEAAWRWRFFYESHWGNHLFLAMATVHEVRFRLSVE